MLCASGRDLDRDPARLVQALQDKGGWYFEVKLDGIRAQANWDSDGVVKLINRRGVDITFRYPEIVNDLQFQRKDAVLDGEIVVLDSYGVPSFTKAHLRDSQYSTKAITHMAIAAPATFIVFDVLKYMGQDWSSRSYIQRRQLLEKEIFGVRLCIASDDGPTLWKAVEDLKLEGVVAKRVTSRYRGVRSKDWIKIRRNCQISCLVSGYDVGEGSRAGTFGALELALWDGEKLVHVGRVGTGFTERDLDLISRDLKSGKHLVVEIEYLELTKDGKLRFPVFRGVRRDVALHECTTDQIQEKV